VGTTWLELRLTNLLHEPAVRGIVVNLHDVSARRQVQDELEHRASTDALTGLPNRTVLLEQLAHVLTLGPTPEVAVVYCDLDGFKAVNDRFGHDEGDRLLVVVAARLAASVRNHDLVARLGGDEFAVLVQGPSSRARAEAIATRIVEALRIPLAVGGASVPVSVSVGVACRSGQVETPSALLRSADAAMYRAKRAGGDRVVLSVAGSADADAASTVPTAS
jgi:diguanylate cyclase (GGDEF)-like protein